MADHAVGGVDRLVGERAGQPRENHPEERRHHAIGEILGQALDRRATDRGFVDVARVAADDVGDGDTAADHAVLFETTRHAQHMPIEAALREQATGQYAAQDDRDDAGQMTIEKGGEHKARQQRDRQEQDEREHSIQAPLARRSRA